MRRLYSICFALALAWGAGLVASPALAQTPTVTALAPSTGPSAGGTTVTITGTNFTGGAGVFDGTVFFGATPATGVTLVTFSSLQAVSPAGAGTVDVTVIDNTNGASSPAGAGNDFTYTAPPPVPTLTEWAMILLAAVLAAVAVKTVMHSRREA